MLVQAGLCRTCSGTTLLVFPRGGSYVDLNHWTSALYFMGLFGMGNNVVSFDGLGTFKVDCNLA